MPALPKRSSVRLPVSGIVAAAVLLTAWAQTEPRPTTALHPATRAAVTRQQPRRAAVEGLTEPVSNLRILDMSGRDISTQVDARITAGKLSLDLAQPTAIVLKPKTIQTIETRAHERITLPGGALVPLQGDPANAANDKAQWFRLTYVASPVPATWDEKAESYLTQLTFGLKRPDGAPTTLVLDQPVIVKLGYQGLSAAETTMISLEAAGLENEKTVPLHFKPQNDKPTVLVRSTISDVNLVLSALPRLDLQPERDRILGFGLDRLNVAISRIEADGRSAPVAATTPIAITVEGRARLDSAPVELAAGAATTRFMVHSSGLGELTIRASADGVSGATTVRQTFPVGCLVATLIGGALGGFARRFVKGSRRAANARRVIEGLVVASIAFVAGVLGVGYLSLPESIVATEAGAFLTASLAGFVGVSVLEMLARKSAVSVAKE